MPTCLSISAIFLTMVSSTSGDDTFFSVATTTPFVAVAATRTNRRSRQQRGACTSPSRVGAGPDEIPSARWRSQHARHAPPTVHAARNFEKRRCTMARDKQAEEARHAEPHEAPPRTRPQRACGGVCRPAPLAPAVGRPCAPPRSRVRSRAAPLMPSEVLPAFTALSAYSIWTSLPDGEKVVSEKL